MPVRLRITFLFALMVMVILGLASGGIYYFFYAARIDAIKTRLTNRAITVARLLARKEIFDHNLIQRIDSLTAIALKNKTVEAYDYRNKKIYSYSEKPGDTIYVSEEILDDARVNGDRFFTIGDKEAVAYHYSDSNARLVIVSAAEDTDGKEALRTLSNILIFIFLAGIAIIMVAGYLFSASLLGPVKKITADVQEISARNLSRRIKMGRTKDEWYKLSDTLNDLLNRLQESFELQRRFISNASHELSTPLTSITSQLEVSLQREREAQEYKKVMQSIHRDVRQMSKLTKTLLEFAKASGSAGGLEIDLIRMDEIVMKLPAEIAKINPAYKVTIDFSAPPENQNSLLVFGNEELMLTAIKNIVLNACKYSSDSKAMIKLEVRDQTIIVSIEDRGKGIPETELKSIFQPFYRVQGHLSGEGFGLGLSLADRIVKLHRGSIDVSSVVGKGTRFAISLPSAAYYS
jgi:signal transduction histidine kinase